MYGSANGQTVGSQRWLNLIDLSLHKYISHVTEI